MEQNFEHWLGANKKLIDVDAYGLLCDSLKCFKNDIDRPSYLLAYQAMMIQIKKVLLKGSRPDGYIEGQWNKLMADLQREDGWDSIVFDAIRERQRDRGGSIIPPVIRIDDAKRDDFLHWRNLRNVCAHYKDAVFTKAHTLTLYSFIQENLLSITVQGGFEMLLQEFKDYYNPVKTNREIVQITPLLNKIQVMIPLNEQEKFVETLLDGFATPVYWENDEALELMKCIWEHSDALKRLLCAYFQKHKEKRVYFLECNPSAVLDIFEEKEIHELCYKYLPRLEKGMLVLCELLIARLIPKTEIDSLNKRFLSEKYHYNLPVGELKRDQVAMLNEISYFDYFVNQYLNPAFTSDYNRLSALNYKTRFYMTHIQYLDFNNENNVRSIHDVFSQKYCPYFLIDDFKAYLKGNMERYNELDETLKRMTLSLPDKISLS